MTAVLPTVIVVGGATYLLAQQAPTPPMPIVRTTGGALPAHGQASWYTPLPADQQNKVDLLMQAAEARFASLSQTAKSSAAQTLNEQLGTHLNGTEDWQSVVASASAAGAQAACTTIPGIGTFTAPLCGIAGAYLGTQLSDWLSSELGDLQRWARDNISASIGNAIDDVVDGVSGWLHGLF